MVRWVWALAIEIVKEIKEVGGKERFPGFRCEHVGQMLYPLLQWARQGR